MFYYLLNFVYMKLIIIWWLLVRLIIVQLDTIKKKVIYPFIGEMKNYLRFPKDEIIRKQWVASLRRKGYNPSNYATLCSRHFRKEDYVVNNKGMKYLKKGAVPSIFNFYEDPTRLNYGQKKILDPITQFEDTLCSSPISVHNNRPVMKLIPCQPALCITDYNNCFPQLKAEMDIESTCQKPVYQSDNSKAIELEEVSDTFERVSSPSRSGSIIRKRGPVLEHIEDFEESDLEIKSKRHQYWNVSQQTFEKYRKRITYLRTKLKKQNEKIRAMNRILDDLKKKQ
nr:uncharacterized protein LOC111510396 isoform X2 [Leptinotarsa decemlineata]